MNSSTTADRTPKCSWGKGIEKGEVLGFLHWMEKVGFLLLHGMFWDFRTSLGNYLLGVSAASNVWGILFFFVSEKACLGIFSGQWNNSSFTPSAFSNPTVVYLFLIPWNFWPSNFVFNRKNKQTKTNQKPKPKTNKHTKQNPYCFDMQYDFSSKSVVVLQGVQRYDKSWQRH